MWYVNFRDNENKICMVYEFYINYVVCKWEEENKKGMDSSQVLY